MCASVWVEFNLRSMGLGLNLLFLHTCILLLLVMKPASRLLYTLVSTSLLLSIGASLLAGAFFSVTISAVTDSSLDILLPGLMALSSILVQGARPVSQKKTKSTKGVFFSSQEYRCSGNSASPC